MTSFSFSLSEPLRINDWVISSSGYCEQRCTTRPCRCILDSSSRHTVVVLWITFT